MRTLLALGGAVLCALAALLIARPAIVVGESEEALMNSLAREIHGEYASYVDCGPERAGARECEVTDVNGAGSARWHVERGSRGCWKARRMSAAGATATPQPERASGCAWLRDYTWIGIPDEFE